MEWVQVVLGGLGIAGVLLIWVVILAGLLEYLKPRR